MTKPKLNDYDQAIAMLKQVEDAAYRAALIDTLIAARVKRELGFDHPSGDLAMRLRREAKAAKAA
jgi:hypothetical protein